MTSGPADRVLRAPEPDAPGLPEAGLSEPGAEGPAAAGQLRRRALEVAALAYTSAHGHPLEHPAHGRVRWEVGTRSLVAAAVALAVLVGVVAVRAVVEPSQPPARAADVAPLADRLPGERPVPPSDGPGPVPGPGDAGRGPDAGGDGTTADGDAEAPGPVGMLVVHVVGAVAEPGVVSLPDGARVADAVAATGGATADADLGAVNLARVLVDGEQVRIPVPGEELAPAPAPPGHDGSDQAGRGGDGGPVDLNRAGAETLETLPGIGPVLARRIVDHRESRGPFTSVEQLAGVSGIGPKLLAGLRDHVQVDG